MLYDEINDLAPLRRALALRNGLAIVRSRAFALGVDVELTLNRWLSNHGVLSGLIFSYDYLFAHFFVTFGVLVWLWWARPDLYREMRTRLVVINLIGLAVFWRYPLAPPRMLTGLGFRDIITITHAVGSYHSGALAQDADQYAAMPSLHIAGLLVGHDGLRRMWQKPAVRVLAAVLYPIITVFVVLATGNHYVLDVAAGFATYLLTTALHLGLARARAGIPWQSVWQTVRQALWRRERLDRVGVLEAPWSGAAVDRQRLVAVARVLSHLARELSSAARTHRWRPPSRTRPRRRRAPVSSPP